MSFEAKHLLAFHFCRYYVENWPVHTIEQCLRQKTIAWVDTSSHELTRFSDIIEYESIQGLMFRYTLLFRPIPERQKVHESTQNTNVSTQTRNESTHPIMHRLILSWFCLTGAWRGMCRCIAALCRHIIVQNAIFLSFCTVFRFSTDFLHYCPSIRYGCNN